MWIITYQKEGDKEMTKIWSPFYWFEEEAHRIRNHLQIRDSDKGIVYLVEKVNWGI